MPCLQDDLLYDLQKRCNGSQRKERLYKCDRCCRLSGKSRVPFRDAHGIVGQLVLLCIEKGIALDDLSLEEYKEISPVFEEDIYEAISMKTCVEKRMTIGAPGPEAMKQVIAVYKKQLQ